MTSHIISRGGGGFEVGGHFTNRPSGLLKCITRIIMIIKIATDHKYHNNPRSNFNHIQTSL